MQINFIVWRKIKPMFLYFQLPVKVLLSILVTLSPMVPNDTVSVRWSPKGEKLLLTESKAGLSTEFSLGPKDLGQVKLILSKSKDALYPDLLQGDWNHNGSLADDSVIRTVPKETRGKMWSSFSASIDIPVKDPVSGKQVINPYPLNLWYVYDPVEPDAEKVIRYSRRGWMQGSFETDSLQGLILLTEMQMDGVYDSLDSWALALKTSPKDLYGTNSKACTDHAWLGDRAFKIAEIDPSGRRVKLVSFNPGMSQEDEAVSRDMMAVDRQAAHSGKSVNFSHDYKAALKEAKSQSKPMLIDFETTWCGPCKQMDQWVYNADLVVAKSVSLVSVKVDGDDNRDLVKQFKVNAYPTIILVGSDGKELRRLVGYQSVNQMVAFLSL
jgi:thiol:disulfide interchange protein DsbD